VLNDVSVRFQRTLSLYIKHERGVELLKWLA